MSLTPDIVEQLQHDFPAEEFDARVAQLAKASSEPRIQRCIVFAARGHSWYFDFLCELANIDFRDVIVAAEYTRQSDRLYNFNRPIPEARIEDPKIEK